MARRGFGAAVLLVLSGAVRAFAGTEELVADRPYLAESGFTVMAPRAQFEAGGSLELQSSVKTIRGPELMVRFAPLSRVEFRLGLPDYVRQGVRHGASGHLGNTYVGAKVALMKDDSPLGIAIVPGFTTPADPKIHGDAAPQINVACSEELAGPYAMRGNIGYAWRETGNQGPDRATGALMVSRDLALGWATFVEWAAEIPKRGGSSHILHHGYTLSVFPDAQLDLHLGVGLSAAAPDFFFGAGATVRH